MEGLMAHRKGTQVVDRAVLDLVPVPGATDTYQPISHYQLADTLTTMGRDILTGWDLTKEHFAVAREGQQMFGVLTFSKGPDEMGLSIGFRNSYDKSMSIGICIGARVFVCDNMSFSGEITVLRKHTQNVWKNLEDTALGTLYRSQKQFEQIQVDAEGMKALPMGDEDAFRELGRLFGHGVLSPRQLSVALAQWQNPAHADFQPRNRWSFYNATTEALKTAAPIIVMEKHIQAHELLKAA